jgi:hypothetical protein
MLVLCVLSEYKKAKWRTVKTKTQVRMKYRVQENAKYNSGRGKGTTSLLFSRYRDSFPGTKQPGRKVDHSPPFSAEVKNEWSLASAPHICFHGVR